MGTVIMAIEKMAPSKPICSTVIPATCCRYKRLQVVGELVGDIVDPIRDEDPGDDAPSK